MTLNKQNKLKKNKRNEFITENIIFIIGGMIIIGIVIGMSLNTHDEHQNTNVTPAQTVFASNTLKVAKKFACSCGTCGEKNLVACVCGTAIGTKQFIESNLQSGMPEGEVVELVKEYYGHFFWDNQLRSVYD